MAAAAILLMSSLLPLGALSPARADGNVDSALLWFDSHDIDKDGKVTDAEVIRMVQRRFRRTDANQDGVLFLREYLDGIPSNRPDEIQRYTLRFQAMDVNHDDQVTVEEMLDYTRKIMHDADLNGDGATTRAEFAAAAKRPK
jgi:Ca2+-binding EF-hand superfamily protein